MAIVHKQEQSDVTKASPTLLLSFTSHPVNLYLICLPSHATRVSLTDLFIVLLSLQGLLTIVDFWSLHLFALGCLSNSASTFLHFPLPLTFNQLFTITVHNPSENCFCIALRLDSPPFMMGLCPIHIVCVQSYLWLLPKALKLQFTIYLCLWFSVWIAYLLFVFESSCMDVLQCYKLLLLLTKLLLWTVLFIPINRFPEEFLTTHRL